LRKLRIPSEEPYRKVVLAFLNKLLRPNRKWWKKTVKSHLRYKFVDCLSDMEADENYDLRTQVDLCEVFSLFQEITGIRLSQMVMDELRTHSDSLTFVNPDLVALEPTVKYMNLIEHSSGVVLHYEARKCRGREAERLYALANEKFQDALSQSPNSTSTLYQWGKMLHRMALRCYNPQRVMSYQKTTSNPQSLIVIGKSRSTLPITNPSKTQGNSIPQKSSPWSSSNQICGIRNSNSNERHSWGTTSTKADERVKNERNSLSSTTTFEHHVIDYAKAEEYFMSSEEKFNRARQIAPTNLEIRNHFVGLLFDYVEFLFEKAKISPFREAKTTFQRAKQKCVSLANLDKSNENILLKNAKFYVAQLKKATGFKTQQHMYNCAATIYCALLKKNKASENVNFQYGVLLFRFYVICMRKRRQPEEIEIYRQKAVKRLQFCLQSNPQLLAILQKKLFKNQRIADLTKRPENKNNNNNSNNDNITLDDVVAQLSQFLSCVRQIISHLSSTVEMAFKPIFQSLRLLNFKGTFVDSDADDKVIKFLRDCPSLTHLILDECKITDETMTFISKNLKNLEYLSCVGCKQITLTKFFETIPDTIADNVALSPISTSSISRNDNQTVAIFDLLQNMNTVKRNRSERPNDSVVAVHYHEASLRASGLKKAHSTTIQDGEAKSITKESPLTSNAKMVAAALTVTPSPVITEGYLCLQKLTYLNLSQCPLISNEAIPLIAYFRNLEKLYLSGVNRVLDDAFMALVLSLPKLSVIDVSDCYQLTSRGVQFLEKQTTLSELYLTNCKNVTDDGLQAILRGCIDLTVVDVSYLKDITNATLKLMAAKLRHLRVLKVAYCTLISDSGVKALTKLGSSLEELDLTGLIEVTDESIVAIARSCPQLKTLILRGCTRIYGISLNEIANNCRHLGKLDISHCHSINHGVQEIVASCPALDEVQIASLFHSHTHSLHLFCDLRAYTWSCDSTRLVCSF